MEPMLTQQIESRGECRHDNVILVCVADRQKVSHAKAIFWTAKATRIAGISVDKKLANTEHFRHAAG